MKRTIAVLISLSLCAALHAQPPATPAIKPKMSPGGYYCMPLDIPIVLAGGFAEIRSWHFHSGIDIKTDGREGLPVYAVADGFVSRVTVTPSGYGRALYIEHPNGTTSVYGHMSRFSPSIEDYLGAERYRLQSDAVDLSPTRGQFSFKRGDVIGYSGNSGMSTGPHLHFEIRDTPSQRTLNTVANGTIPITDTTPPTIFRLWYIQVDTVAGVPLNAQPREIRVKSVYPGKYIPVDLDIRVAHNGYFVVETIDYMNGSPNRLGIYRASLRVDAQKVIEQKRDRFLFSDTRYADAVEHFGLKRDNPNELVRMVLLEGNKLPIYDTVVDRGALRVMDFLPHLIAIEIEDASKNVSRVDLTVRLGESEQQRAPIGQPIARNDLPFTYNAEGAGITIPAGSLYEPVFYTQRADSSAVLSRRLSPIHCFLNPETPLHTTATIWIAAQIPARLRTKVILAAVSDSGTLSSAGGKWLPASGGQPERVEADVRSLGRYCVVSDTIAPRIAAQFKSGTDVSSQTLVFTVTDNFSGIKSYSGTIDGKWALMERDILRNKVSFVFDRKRLPLAPGTHTITLTVSDKVGNSASYKGTFLTR